MSSSNIQVDEDFLAMSMEIIRQSISGIESSYSNYWDLLAELIQNAVDAINKVDRLGKINIIIDCPNRTVSIKDNGCGIAPNDVSRLLKLFSTNKSKDPKSIGEKGVGLKFAYFQSLRFIMRTGTVEGSTEAQIDDARLWKISNGIQGLALKTRRLDSAIEGTEVILEDIDNDELFSLSYEQLVYILRTKTAIGNTRKIWETIDDIDVTLTLIDSNGDSRTETIINKYLLPTEVYTKNTLIDIDDYNEWLKEKDRSDADKRKKLQDKIIVKKMEDNSRIGRRIRVWACFVPKREVWGRISKAAKLLSEKEFENDYTDSEWKREHKDLLFNEGIYTAVKGMPTTISVDPPSTGNAGYWANMFFIFEDDGLNFDIGRKFIHGKTTTIYKNIAADIFREITKVVTKYVSGSPDIFIPFDFQNLLLEINQMPNVVYKKDSGVLFEKSPSEQEASVAGIFFELIGAGKIKNITPIISGYRNRYDLYARFNGRIVIIEFKSRLKNIIRDFSETRKIFDEMNYIVCWGITDEDTKELNKVGIQLDKLKDIETDLSVPNGSYIPESTHMMCIQNVNPVFVIDLKELVCN